MNTRQVENVVVTVVFGSLATLVVAGRFIAKKVQHAQFNSSDWTMLLAWFFAITAIISNLVAVADGGLGQHQAALDASHVSVYLKSITALQLLWAAAEGSVKSSMCLLYIHLFPQKWFHITAYSVLALCNAFALAVILGTVFICDPVSLSWNPAQPGSCGNRVGMWVAIGVLNILTDLCVVLLPIPVLWNLSLKTAKKIGLIFIFGLGIFVCVVSGVRLKFLLDVDFAGDASYQIAAANIWSILEPTLAITFGCLPTLRPLFRRVTGRTSKQSVPVYDRDDTYKRQDFTKLPDDDLITNSVSVSVPHGKTGPHSKMSDADGVYSMADLGNNIEVTRQFEISYETKSHASQSS